MRRVASSPFSSGIREVQDGDIRTGLNGEFNSLPAVCSLPADRPSYLLLEQLLEPSPDHFVVVCKENANAHRGLAVIGKGMAALTRVPDGPDTTSRVPLSCSMRTCLS